MWVVRGFGRLAPDSSLFLCVIVVCGPSPIVFAARPPPTPPHTLQAGWCRLTHDPMREGTSVNLHVSRCFQPRRVAPPLVHCRSAVLPLHAAWIVPVACAACCHMQCCCAGLLVHASGSARSITCLAGGGGCSLTCRLRGLLPLAFLNTQGLCASCTSFPLLYCTAPARPARHQGSRQC